MADADFDDFETFGRRDSRYGSRYERHPAPTVPAGVRLQRLINGAGALTSVALIGGLSFWGYELAVRDVQGIPVIRALEGPARIAPDDPGGDVALHQGLAVNRIAADGAAADAADTLTLAPRASGLAEEDQPMGDLVTASVPPPAAPRGQETVPAGEAIAAAPVSLDPAAVLVLAEQVQRPVLPLPDGPVASLDASADIENAEIPAVAAITASTPGVKVSPRPVSRPIRLASAAIVAPDTSAAAPDTATDASFTSDAMAEAAAAAVAAALAPPPALDVASEDLAAGTRLVQIGAYSSAEEASTQWDTTAERYGSLLDGKRRVIEPATSGGQVFYRLRVEGFSDIDDARRFCAALLADKTECVPAVVR